MTQQNIDAKNVTRPIQLLAAWLIGLILTNSGFLAAATQLHGIERMILVVAAVANVPIFLIALFLLQTKFRPEMQEDVFYSRYLDNKTNQVVTKNRIESLELEMQKVHQIVLSNVEMASVIPNDEARNSMPYSIGINRHLRKFSDIYSVVESSGVNEITTFGAKEQPVGEYMAIDRDLRFNYRLRAIRLAIECEIDGYGYFSHSEEMIDEAVLIGAYGLQGEQIPITSRLKDIIVQNISMAELANYENEFRRMTD